MDLSSAHRMGPGLGRQDADGRLERSAQGASSTGSPPPRSESVPTRLRSIDQGFGSSQLLTNRVKVTVRPQLPRSARTVNAHLLRAGWIYRETSIARPPAIEIGARNRSRCPQSWQGSTVRWKASKIARGRAAISAAGTSRPRAVFQNGVWGKCSLQKTRQRAMVCRSAPKSRESSRTRRGPLPHGRDQDDHRPQVDLPTQEPHRRGRHPLAAPLPLAAEAQPAAIRLRKFLASTPWLAGVVGPVQMPSTGTLPLASALGEVLIDGEKKRPEAGMARQLVVHGGVLR